MKTLQQERDRAEIAERVTRLAPDAPAGWGSMTCTRMLAHVADSLRMATGELPTRFKRTPLRFAPVRYAVIYWLPFPKGTPTAPELLSREPGEWSAEVDAVRECLARFGEGDPPAGWPVHPVFGKMTARDWGTLQYRHLDHHLRQFGV